MGVDDLNTHRNLGYRVCPTKGPERTALDGTSAHTIRDRRGDRTPARLRKEPQ
jgi:hypothetical protein